MIVGGANSTANNVVRKCIASMEEYDSDFDVDSYPLLNMARIQMIFENVLGEGHEDIWEFVIDENRPNTGNNKDEYPYYLKAPFLTLKHTY